MPRGVDEVELVDLTIGGLVIKRHALGLDGDAPLPLDVHGVQHLGRHLPVAEGTGKLDEAIGDGRFSMIDVGDDGKVADVTQIGHRCPSGWKVGRWGPGALAARGGRGLAPREERRIIAEPARAGPRDSSRQPQTRLLAHSWPGNGPPVPGKPLANDHAVIRRG